MYVCGKNQYCTTNVPPYVSSIEKKLQRWHQRRGEKAYYVHGDKSIVKDGKEKLCSSPAVYFGMAHASCCLRLITDTLLMAWGMRWIKKFSMVWFQLWVT